MSHSEFNKHAYGVFNERGNWHLASTRQPIEGTSS